MKKLFVLFLLLFAVTSVVSAQSLFPALSTPTPEPSDLAPSYSGFANVEPDKKQDLGEQGQVLTYYNVEEENYIKFGDYLAGLGFEAIQTNVNGRTAEMILDNGKFNIGISYNANNMTLLNIYEKDTDYEKKDYFKQYERASIGDMLIIDSGSVKIKEIKIYDGYLWAYNRYLTNWWWNLEDYQILGTYVLFDYSNWKSSIVNFYSTKYSISGKNDLGTFTLKFITETGNEYSYDMDLFGKIKNINNEDCLLYGELVGKNSEDSARWRLDPVSSYSLAAGFTKVPIDVKTAPKSSLALIIDNQYAIVLREHGKKIGKW